jgi:dienelactone hydrolase
MAKQRSMTRLALRLVFSSLVAGCAALPPVASVPATTPAALAEEIPFRVSRPDGPGPFPAVVIMHDCSGLGPRSSGAPKRWATELVAHGYVVIIPDSFTTRGHAAGVCTDPSPSRFEVSPYRRARDAYAALAYARSLPYVDGRSVGLMGGSHGGSTTLVSMSAPLSDKDPLAKAKREGFAAAVALYPGCAIRLGSWRRDATSPNGVTGVYRPTAPLYILIGEKDDWTPAEPCRKLAEAAQAADQPVMIKIYPGALHSFDNRSPVRYNAARMNANAPGGRGATTGGDPVAWADSIREVEAFFERYLKQKEN